MIKANKESIEDFGEDDMPCPCEECGEWFDLNDGVTHPRKGRLVICESCANRIEKDIEREEEIEELLSSISDAEYTIKDARKRLQELGYNQEAKLTPSEPVEQRWISAEERLPVEGNYVLVYTTLYGGYCDLAFYESGSWWEYTDEPMVGVTHWEPLPSPPKI